MTEHPDTVLPQMAAGDEVMTGYHIRLALQKITDYLDTSGATTFTAKEVGIDRYIAKKMANAGHIRKVGRVGDNGGMNLYILYRKPETI